MIYELNRRDFNRVRPIFEGLHYHLVIFSIIEGNSPGIVYVDNEETPKSAFIWDQTEGGFYLAGNHKNHEFNRDLNRWITDRIYKEAKRLPHLMDFTLNWHPGSWEDAIDVVLKNTYPMKHFRKHFAFKKQQINWRDYMPPDYIMQQVDEELLCRKTLKNIEKVTEWVMGNWKSVENFKRKGFGFCLLHGDAIISWSIADFTTGGDYEIGIHTDPDYRRRGFATLTASAAVEYCLMHGGKNIGWHCWSNNDASAATALKVGFELAVEHPVYHAWYNQFDNLLVQAHFYFQRKDYSTAANIYDSALRKWDQKDYDASVSRIFGEHDQRKWCYYEAARANAVIGEDDTSVNNLKKAINAGFSDLKRIESDDMLKSLHNRSDWNVIVQK